MSEYNNELRGALFKNNRKREGKQDPDYNGSATINGVDYYLDAWINSPKAGVGTDKYMAIKFKAKDVQPSAVAPSATPAAAAPPSEFNDDIPF